MGLVGDAIASLPRLCGGQCTGERFAVQVAPRRRLLTQHAAVDRQLRVLGRLHDLRLREETQHLAHLACAAGGDTFDREPFREALRRLEGDAQQTFEQVAVELRDAA